MNDPKQKIIETLEKQKQAIEAQRKESERIEKERQAQITNETVQSFQSPSQPPNK